MLCMLSRKLMRKVDLKHSYTTTYNIMYKDIMYKYKFKPVKARTRRYKDSPIHYMTKLLNSDQ